MKKEKKRGFRRRHTSQIPTSILETIQRSASLKLLSHISAIRALSGHSADKSSSNLAGEAGERVGKTDASLTCGGTFGFLTYY
jgi:hypothetical protein